MLSIISKPPEDEPVDKPGLFSRRKSKTQHLTSEHANATYGFGLYEDQGKRKSQEDAVAWYLDDLANSKFATFSPEDIGYRLWTAYQILDEELFMGEDDDRITAGTTASTTVYDGKGNLITATVGDSIAYAVIYDLNGYALGVQRLNSILHHPTVSSEKKRINKIDKGIIRKGRIQGSLALSRAIGDHAREYKEDGVCSEAQIDSTSIYALLEEFDLDLDPSMYTFQIISTCDGYTECMGALQTKSDQENYLLHHLRSMRSLKDLSEVQIAKKLVTNAIDNGSMDNVSVAIQTIDGTTPPFTLSVFDGHGGKDASCYVVDNFFSVFMDQCGLSGERYAEQPLSVNQRRDVYDRDHGAKKGREVTPEAESMANSSVYSVFDSEQGRLINQVNTFIRCLAEQRVADAINLFKVFSLGKYLDEPGLIHINLINFDHSFVLDEEYGLLAIALTELSSEIEGYMQVLMIENSNTLGEIVRQIPGLEMELGVEKPEAGPA